MYAERNTISIRGLAVSYGTSNAITDLDLDVRRGEVFALVGRNGIGKTTVLRALVNQVPTTSGSVTVLGMDPSRDSTELQSRTGVLIDDLEPMGILSARDVLWLCAAVRGCDLEYAEKLADRLRLDLDHSISEMSAGCRRALGIVQALMHDPELVILDEPAAGLDPAVRQEVFALLRDVTVRGGTVILTAHELDDVAVVADRAAVLRPELNPLVVSITAHSVRGSDHVLVD